MKTILGLCICVVLQLALLNEGVFGQTSHIEMGSMHQYPTIYNRTIEMKPPQRPWYNRWFSRSIPMFNVSYTFPPNQYNVARCLIAGVTVNDVEPYGKGGLAKVIGGGPNHDSVTINFSSRTGYPMLFRIILTGICMNNNNSSTASPYLGGTWNTGNLTPSNTSNTSYGWTIPSNQTINYSSSSYTNFTNPYSNSSSYNSTYYNSTALAQNRTMTPPSYPKPWWHFW